EMKHWRIGEGDPIDVQSLASAQGDQRRTRINQSSGGISPGGFVGPDPEVLARSIDRSTASDGNIGEGSAVNDRATAGELGDVILRRRRRIGQPPRRKSFWSLDRRAGVQMQVDMAGELKRQGHEDARRNL